MEEKSMFDRIFNNNYMRNQTPHKGCFCFLTDGVTTCDLGQIIFFLHISPSVCKRTPPVTSIISEQFRQLQINVHWMSKL